MCPELPSHNLRNAELHHKLPVGRLCNPFFKRMLFFSESPCTRRPAWTKPTSYCSGNCGPIGCIGAAPMTKNPSLNYMKCQKAILISIQVRKLVGKENQALSSTACSFTANNEAQTSLCTSDWSTSGISQTVMVEQKVAAVTYKESMWD